MSTVTERARAGRAIILPEPIAPVSPGTEPGASDDHAWSLYREPRSGEWHLVLWNDPAFDDEALAWIADRAGTLGVAPGDDVDELLAARCGCL